MSEVPYSGSTPYSRKHWRLSSEPKQKLILADLNSAVIAQAAKFNSPPNLLIQCNSLSPPLPYIDYIICLRFARSEIAKINSLNLIDAIKSRLKVYVPFPCFRRLRAITHVAIASWRDVTIIQNIASCVLNYSSAFWFLNTMVFCVSIILRYTVYAINS